LSSPFCPFGLITLAPPTYSLFPVPCSLTPAFTIERT
jgi:hypothetical protein